jgi:hypothetical protein
MARTRELLIPVLIRVGMGLADPHPARERERGPDRWRRWAAMVDTGVSKAEVARLEGVSRAAVTQGLGKLGV